MLPDWKAANSANRGSSASASAFVVHVVLASHAGAEPGVREHRLQVGAHRAGAGVRRPRGGPAGVLDQPRVVRLRRPARTTCPGTAAPARPGRAPRRPRTRERLGSPRARRRRTRPPAPPSRSARRSTSPTPPGRAGRSPATRRSASTGMPAASMTGYAGSSVPPVMTTSGAPVITASESTVPGGRVLDDVRLGDAVDDLLLGDERLRRDARQRVQLVEHDQERQVRRRARVQRRTGVVDDRRAGQLAGQLGGRRTALDQHVRLRGAALRRLHDGEHLIRVRSTPA